MFGFVIYGKLVRFEFSFVHFRFIGYYNGVILKN